MSYGWECVWWVSPLANLLLSWPCCRVGTANHDGSCILRRYWSGWTALPLLQRTLFRTFQLHTCRGFAPTLFGFRTSNWNQGPSPSSQLALPQLWEQKEGHREIQHGKRDMEDVGTTICVRVWQGRTDHETSVMNTKILPGVIETIMVSQMILL